MKIGGFSRGHLKTGKKTKRKWETVGKKKKRGLEFPLDRMMK